MKPKYLSILIVAAFTYATVLFNTHNSTVRGSSEHRLAGLLRTKRLTEPH